MKARVQASGEIIEVKVQDKYFDCNGHQWIIYEDTKGRTFNEKYLEFNLDNSPLDYWEKLLHQYAGMAMQGMVKTYEQMMRADIECKMDCCEHVDAEVANGVLRIHAEACAEFCVEFATALVEKLMMDAEKDD